MIKSRPVTISLAILVLNLIALGQGQPDLGWLATYSAVPGEPLHSRLDNYSHADLERFRTVLESIKSTPGATEWEGIYVAGGPNEVGISTLRFKVKSGFATLYIYTCTPELRDIDFGAVNDSEDMIEFVSEVPPNSPRKPNRIKFIKVVWGERRFLVREDSLAAFAEKAVGVLVPDHEGGPDWWNFWDSGDFDAKLNGSPRFPKRFRHLERSAISATIIGVRPRRIYPEFSTGRSFHTSASAVYRVVINVGAKHGVKKDLILKVSGTNEDVTITRVGHATSQGVIVRAIDDTTRADHCLSDDAVLIKCPAITPGLIMSTVVGDFFF